MMRMRAARLRSIVIAAGAPVLMLPAPVAAGAHRKVVRRAPAVQVRVPPIHQTDLAASGLGVHLDLRRRRPQRVRVATALAVQGARPVPLSAARTLRLRQGKPRSLRFALAPGARTALAG